MAFRCRNYKSPVILFVTFDTILKFYRSEFYLAWTFVGRNFVFHCILYSLYTVVYSVVVVVLLVDLGHVPLHFIVVILPYWQHQKCKSLQVSRLIYRLTNLIRCKLFISLKKSSPKLTPISPNSGEHQRKISGNPPDLLVLLTMLKFGSRCDRRLGYHPLSRICANLIRQYNSIRSRLDQDENTKIRACGSVSKSQDALAWRLDFNSLLVPA